MVPDLGGVVVETAGPCCGNDLVKGGVGEVGALNQTIEVVDVGSVVLSVVEADRAVRDVRVESVVSVWKRLEGDSHKARLALPKLFRRGRRAVGHHSQIHKRDPGITDTTGPCSRIAQTLQMEPRGLLCGRW